MDNLNRLKTIRSRDVSVENQSLVLKHYLPAQREGILPLVVRPRFKGVDLVEWVTKNMAEFNADLGVHGGILLRGFDMGALAAFGRFVNCFDATPLAYTFRSSPRHELDKSVKNVYNSTVYPKAERINLHNESSYSRTWGMKIMFCCLQPAEEGGETPIADSRKILADIHPDLVEKFKAKGVLYRRKLIRDQGMSWQEVFQTDDRQAVEETCRRGDIAYEFVNDNHLNIEWLKKAVYQHPITGEETWFNHIYFFNKFSRYEELGMSPAEQASSDLIHSDTLFGDGTAISYEEYTNIKKAYFRNTVSFTYEKGDIICLDNMLAAHGRNAYKGDRKIATAIMEPASDN